MRILGKTVAAVAACVFTLHGTAQTEGMDEFVDDLKDEGVVDLPPHACRFVRLL